MAEPGEVGGPQALALGPVQHAHLLVLRGQPIGDRPGPVGRSVVDDEDAKALRRGAAQHVERRGDDALEVLGFVEGGEDEPGRAGHEGRVG